MEIIMALSYNWELINGELYAIPSNTENKDESYQTFITEMFGPEVWFEIAYGLPKLERETAEGTLP
jgi:hypothetical protein